MSASGPPLLGMIALGDEASVDARRRWLGGRTYWVCQGAGWGLLVLSWIASGFDAGVVNVRAMTIRNVCFGLTGIVGSHLLRLLIYAIRERMRALSLFLPLLALALVAAGMAMLGMAAVVAWLVPPFNNPGNYFGRLLQVCVFLGGWMGAYFAVTSQRSYQRELVMRLELDSALREAELRALKSQINPHFLFNCLNSLRALVPLELVRPREAITLLSDLLRAALAAGEQTTVSLAKELETVDAYLALEQIRHEERLRVAREISAEALARPVPPFLIQSLVENAVKYGIATREEGGEVGVSADMHEGILRVRVTNPGRIASGHASTGLGLSNGRARLHHLFGAGATLTLTQAGPERVVAEVSIPARTSASL